MIRLFILIQQILMPGGIKVTNDSILAVILSDLNRYEEAIYAFDKAIKLNPKDSAIWCNKGI